MPQGNSCACRPIFVDKSFIASCTQWLRFGNLIYYDGKPFTRTLNVILYCATAQGVQMTNSDNLGLPFLNPHRVLQPQPVTDKDDPGAFLIKKKEPLRVLIISSDPKKTEVVFCEKLTTGKCDRQLYSEGKGCSCRCNAHICRECCLLSCSDWIVCESFLEL